MKDNFEACFRETLSHEGGWADHPDDPGGATMKGVTIGTFERYKKRKVTKAELRAISDFDLQMIYRKEYWDRVRGDDLPRGLDLVAFDGAVNSGPNRGAKWLQVGLGVVADGSIGPATIAAAQAADVQSVIGHATAARMRFLRGLRTWGTFGRGWTARVEAVRAEALRMANGLPVSTKPAPVEPPVATPVALEPLARPAPSGFWAAVFAWMERISK